MSTVGLPWTSHSTIRPAGSGGAESASNFSSKKAGISTYSTRDRSLSGDSRTSTRRRGDALGEPPADAAPTHTITCRCCETTVQVPIRRRFLCDDCFRTGQ